MLFDGPYGVYCSTYHSYHWMATQGDPGFKYHAAMARFAGVLALRFANADVVPLDAGAYGREIARYLEDVGRLPGADRYAADLRGAAAKARAWSARAEANRRAVERRVAAGAISEPAVAAANRWLMRLERSLLDERGIPDRPWFRHLVYAPLPSYEAETLPGIREAILAGRDARPQIRALASALDAASSAAGRAER
jgi:N-acetylated-alpha-linked acidic dipeptidase